MKNIRITSAFITMFVFLFAMFTFASIGQATDLIITGVIDGPLSGGIPKAIEFYVLNDTADLSIYGFGSANNGGGSDGEEFTFPAVSATAGDFIYVASEETGFSSFFGFNPNYVSGAASINGDDAIELFQNGTVVDVFGDINVDGTDQPWEYLDGWAYRIDGTGPDGTTFILANWSFSGPNALDGETSNATAATPFPIGTYLPGSGPDYTPIYDIQYTTDPSGDSPYKDQADVTTEGIVSALFSDGYFIEDPAGGEWNGLWVYDSANTPALGDRVRLTGTVLEYYSLTELGTLTDYVVVSSGNSIPAPEVLPTDEVSQEQWEGVLVRVENVTITNDDLGYGEWSVSDGSGDVVIDDKGSYLYTPVNGDALAAVIGPLDYTFGAFKIQPRDNNDIILPAPPPSLVINEILADPDAINGDANGDGTIHTSQDEFIEIVNNSDGNVDISGWTLSDAVGVRHTFPAGTVVPAHCTIVVFGGGTPTGAFGNAVVQTASTGMLGLNNGGDTVTLNDGSIDQASVSYGSEGGDNQSLTRDPDITGTFVKHSTATGSGGALFSPGEMVDGSSFPGCSGGTEFGACGDPATFIHEIQGTGLVSPLNGTLGVVIEGVVVGDFQDPATGINGFFIQEEDSQTDGDPMTSEGIFVYDNSLDVNVGDVVRVQGDVDEFFNLTQLDTISNIAVCSQPGSASPAVVTLPFADDTFLERYEGMAVTFPQTLTVTENYNLGRGGEVVLASGRLMNPTNVVLPGPGANAMQAANDLNRIILDDGNTSQNPDPILYPAPGLSALNTLRSGDTVTDLVGVLTYDWSGWSGTDSYRVHASFPPAFVSANPRSASPADVGGSVKIASFNVLNYFVTLDEDEPICGPSGGMDCRGANTADEFTRQRDKIIDAIVTMDADVIGLMEMENHPTDAALQNLVNGLNDAAGAGIYNYINTGTIGTDAIKVAFIYQPGTVSPVGPFTILDSSVDPSFNDERNRPALAQTFEQNTTSEKVTIVVNHLKSKGSSCDDLGDPDIGDGQGNCNLTRTSAAIALTNWLATDPTGSGDPDFLIIGDLNSYAMEDPITAIKNAEYTNLIEMFGGMSAYSYVFEGQAGYLDHALANATLTAQAAGVTEWHINADEPSVLDYNEEYKSAGQIISLYNADQYRASDHDPVIVGLNLRSTFDASKDIVGTDRLPETPIFDVFAGDIFTYTIEFENPFEQAVYFQVSDTLDMYLEYLSGPFTMTPGGLEYTELLDAGEMLSLSFDIQVKDVAPIGWIIENIAIITAYLDPDNIAGTTLAVVEAIAPQGRVIPEPMTLLLLGTGLLGIAALVQRKRRQKKGN